VIVIVVCISRNTKRVKRLYRVEADGSLQEKICSNINPYLVDGRNFVVESRRDAPGDRFPMLFGNMPRDGGSLLLDPEEKIAETNNDPVFARFLRQFVGSEDFIHGKPRYCLWIDKASYEIASSSSHVARRLKAVREMRLASNAASTRDFAKFPYRFVQIQGAAKKWAFIIPRHSSARREYLPVGLLDHRAIVADSAFAIYDAPLWIFAVLASRLHLAWIAAVCGQLKTDYRYSNTLGWNTFPLPKLTEQNVVDLNACATRILLAREAYYPATIGEMYDPDHMVSNFFRLREAHDANDETIERIYVGRRFKNDTERLEILFTRFAPASAAISPQNS
jgi:hypothetical protein